MLHPIYKFTTTLFLILTFLSGCHSASNISLTSIRIATFNVSIEAGNYSTPDNLQPELVTQHLNSGKHPQLKNIAEILQRTKPDIVLLNEFDYISNPSIGINALIKNYLNQSQNNQNPIDYPHYYIAPVNTGKPSDFDLDNDGKHTNKGADAWGYGVYPGQYGMALLSRFPINKNQVRTLQNFLWHDMPNALQPTISNNQTWYSAAEWQSIPLSSKSHWDIPIDTPNGIIHVIAAHPTPPTFDGDEDRNGKRNHDEIRLINDYLNNAQYIYDDLGQYGGLSKNARFVVLGDLNSSPNEGDSIHAGIKSLLSNKRVNPSCEPSSLAGQLNRPDNPNSKSHTAAWGLRVDYALPSKNGLTIKDCQVYWPSTDTPEHRLLNSREASSDHRLVWIDLIVK